MYYVPPKLGLKYFISLVICFILFKDQHVGLFSEEQRPLCSPINFICFLTNALISFFFFFSVALLQLFFVFLFSLASDWFYFLCLDFKHFRMLKQRQ